MKNKTGRGFTLIEVLIAMTLLSIMVTLLFASLKICADSWHKGENKIANVNEIATVYHFFQHYLVTAKPITDNAEKKADGSPVPLAFQGTKQSLQFVAALPASASRLGLQLFSVYQQQDVIKVSITPFLSSKNSKEEVILLTGVSDFSITYFGSDDLADNNASSASWQDNWLEKTAQPQLVSIHIELNNGQFWPDMLIAPKAQNLVTIQ
jgi:general secretion pathway protein J